MFSLIKRMLSTAKRNELLADSEASLIHFAENDKCYPLNAGRTLFSKLLCLLPPSRREPIAECLLRRKSSPGPASEHLIQHLLSDRQHKRKRRKIPEAVVSKAADLFYAHQYRQYLNPQMAAFAATAIQVLAAGGGQFRGLLWRRHRRTAAAMLEPRGDAKPILVLSKQTVAVALFLPMAKRTGERREVARWLAGKQAIPNYYARLLAGEVVHSTVKRCHTLERSRDGAMLELLDAALSSGRLALLALHPYDSDAMGLHITLFGVEALEAEQLRSDYGIDGAGLQAYREQASQTGHHLVFLVGGTEEVFTQCSQNLFVKAPAPDVNPKAVERWYPNLPIERLLAKQFESLQITVSSSGLPGVSPRNGDLGKAVFVAERDGRTYLLIPYHPGNAVHGHAAKIWSNPYSTVAIFDDHSHLCNVMFSGRSAIVFHEKVKKRFPKIAEQVEGQTGRKGKIQAEPEYWFLQRVERIIQQSEAPTATRLSPLRSTCGIAAGGQALYNKKPGYFAAESLPPYDQGLQHRREGSGRPTSPGGLEYAEWRKCMQAALSARQNHLSTQAKARSNDGR
jgi:hypothetical protein